MIYLGADHGGLETKEKVKSLLKAWGFPYQDLGNTVFDKGDDYPDFASRVAEKVSQKEGDSGILICRSGHGMDIMANKFIGVRAALCFTPPHAEQSREHEDANVLCLANDYVPEEEIKRIVQTFLTTKFSFEERHKRRIEKIKAIERRNFK